MALAGVLLVIALTGKPELLVAAAAAALILIPEFFFALAAQRIMATNQASFGRALSARFLRLIGIVVFLALGLRLLQPEATAAAVWMLTVLILVITPVVSAIVHSRQAKLVT